MKVGDLVQASGLPPGFHGIIYKVRSVPPYKGLWYIVWWFCGDYQLTRHCRKMELEPLESRRVNND